MYTHAYMYSLHASSDASLLVSFPFQPMALLETVKMSKIFDTGEATPTKIVVHELFGAIPWCNVFGLFLFLPYNTAIALIVYYLFY